MKKYVAILTILFVTIVLAKDWYRLDCEEGNCSIEFPEKPLKSVINDDEHYEKIIKFRYKLIERTTDYELNIYFLKSNPKNVKEFLTEKINKILQDNSGVKKDLLELNIDEILGYEMDIEINNKFSVRARVFYNQGKYYELIVKMPTERINTSDINMFMNSFRINVK